MAKSILYMRHPEQDWCTALNLMFDILTVLSSSNIHICKARWYSMMIPSTIELTVTWCMASHKSLHFETCYGGEQCWISLSISNREKEVETVRISSLGIESVHPSFSERVQFFHYTHMQWIILIDCGIIKIYSGITEDYFDVCWLPYPYFGCWERANTWRAALLYCSAKNLSMKHKKHWRHII